MEIQLESPNPHTIQSYNDTSITVNGVLYQRSTLITQDMIQTDWSIHSIRELTEETISPLLDYQPEIILIGHSEQGVRLAGSVVSFLSKHRVGIECMSIGAASRTFNVLLSEHRSVVFGFVV